jgi:hypothetical protein
MSWSPERKKAPRQHGRDATFGPPHQEPIAGLNHPSPLMKSVAIPRLDPSFKPSPGSAGIIRIEISILLHVPQPQAILIPEPKNGYYGSSATICPQPAIDQHNMLSLNQNHNLS